jgi:hypothetical protein
MTTTILNVVISLAVNLIFSGIAGFATAKYKKLSKREDALRNGVQSLLRNQLIEDHDKYIKKGFCPINRKDAIRSGYEAYHELGGNGTITKLYNDIMELPETAPPRRKPQ